MLHKKYFFPLIMLLSLLSCSAGKSEFSSKHYLEGLRALSAGRTAAAKKEFSKSIQNDNPLAAALAAEELASLLYEKKDFPALLALNTDTVLPGDTNHIARLKAAAMLQSGHTQTQQILYTRFFSAPFAAADRKLFSDTSLTEALNRLPEHLQTALQFRTAVYTGNYAQALNILKKQTQNDMQTGTASDTAANSNQLMRFFNLYTDIPAFINVCSAVLYGSAHTAERTEYAEQLKAAAQLFPEEDEKAFYCNLYAARLYGRCGETYRNHAFEQYETTLMHTHNAQAFDKALWYYANTALKISNRSAIAVLQTHAQRIHDPSYFDDIFSLLSYNLLSARSWSGCYALYEAMQPYMSADTVSKYAFIAGRLGETGLLGEDFPKEKIRAAFTKSYETAEGDIYYRLLAAERLDIPFADIERSLLKRKKKAAGQADIQAELLLRECITQGLEDKVFPLFLRFKDTVGSDTAVFLIDALCKKELYPQALRTAVRSFGESDVPIKKMQLEMLYPRFYDTVIAPLCANYGVPEYLAYALIRSESFFDKDIQSAAGAAGLTQLMGSTAADIARKLQRPVYDLSDAATNAEFGIFYLQELIGRVDGSPLLGLFSYNAGITKVRRWANSYPELSRDLLLEVLPYKETREYGQKVLTAASIYACLYYGKTTHDIVREIMR